MRYCQGMVRPGVWSHPDWVSGCIDVQYRIAKSINAYHHDIYSVHDPLKVRTLFIDTSAPVWSAWGASGTTWTSVYMPVATSVVMPAGWAVSSQGWVFTGEARNGR